MRVDERGRPLVEEMARKLTARPKTTYPIRAVSQLTHLSVETLRAWERRYQVVRPLRINGRRQYTAQDVSRLRSLKQALDQGYSISRAAALSPGDLSDAGKAPLEPRPAPGLPRALSALRAVPLETIMSSIEAFRYADAERELSRQASLMTSRQVVHELALPLMREAGQRWHQRRLRIAQEHMLSQLLTNLLGGMIRLYTPERPPATLLTSTLSGDQHNFGILAAAMLATGAGLGVIHLGPDLPIREISFAARRSRCDVVLISQTARPDRSSILRELKALRGALPSPTELWAAIGSAAPTRGILLDGVRILADFFQLEREVERIGGRF